MQPPIQPRPFFEKLSASIERSDSLLCVGLDPSYDNLPERFKDTASPISEQLFAWNQAIIEATTDFACVYKPNIAFYEALGAAGYTLLQDTINLIPSDIPILLDAKRGDIGSTAAAYAAACFEQLGVDAVTLNAYLGRDSILPFAAYQNKGLFLLCHTSNPGSSDFQELEISDWRTLDRQANEPLYMHVARSAISWSPNIGLVVGATYPQSIAAIREVAPSAWMLIPGIGAQGGDLESTLSAGLRSDGAGLLINASRGISLADNPADAARKFRDDINRVRYMPGSPAKRAEPVQKQKPLAELSARLVKLGAVKFGSFTLASGMQSPIYIDLRLLVSEPSLLASVAEQYAALLENLPCDRIAGVPYAALPIGTAVSLATHVPMIYPRKEVKSYGLQRGIEGAWSPNERVVIIEDLITSGGSTLTSVERLREAGLVVEHAIVLIDREQGGVKNLADHGVKLHSVFRLTEMLESLVAQRAISQDQAEEIRQFMANSAKQ